MVKQASEVAHTPYAEYQIKKVNLIECSAQKKKKRKEKKTRDKDL